MRGAPRHGPGAPCPAADQIDATYHFALVSTIVGLLGTAASQWRSLRTMRWTVAGITMLCAGSPALSVLTGNPRT